ncbi:hypothetical protein JI739_07360 [Ramlibacter sp. AW1]|uniref:Uncharacterized protein n=1 Tax=Ramlibacter aurantiacus TaxID=2801330 RepID=A0A936ZFV5_9BURK|nr:hypothetical protein [Ramlibacter aurantiacus]MBL0420162.1 hypothetical protein [Ramlibacter aurantiacus]
MHECSQTSGVPHPSETTADSNVYGSAYLVRCGTGGLNMRTFDYEQLLALDYDAVVQITKSREPFCVVADGEVGSRIERFLENERQFRQTKRTFRDRDCYWWRGMQALRLPGFIPVWNRALMDNFTVQVRRCSDETLECLFTHTHR